MELRHLRYFVAVADELHFGRAAQRLHIAQPPLSQQIRRLEQELGIRLFHRANRRVRLTDVGRAFLGEARLTLAQAARAMHIASEAARGEIGHLVIGHMASAELNVFPRLLPVFRKRYPAVDLEFQLLGASEQLERLRDARIHVGFLRLPLSDRTLTVKRIVREPLVAALPAGHPLARRRSVTLRALGREPFVIFQRSHAPGYFDALVALWRKAGLAPALVQETTRLYTALSLVATGRGVSLMPKCVARLGTTGVVYRPVRPIVPYTEMGVVFNPANASRLLQGFLSVVDDVFKPSTPRASAAMVK